MLRGNRTNSARRSENDQQDRHNRQYPRKKICASRLRRFRPMLVRGRRHFVKLQILGTPEFSFIHFSLTQGAARVVSGQSQSKHSAAFQLAQACPSDL